MRYVWGVYDFVEDFILLETFITRREARKYVEFCYDDNGDKNTKVVKLVMQPESRKKNKTEYFSFGDWFYKIGREGDRVSFLSKTFKTWVSASYPSAKELRKCGCRINFNEIKWRVENAKEASS